MNSQAVIALVNNAALLLALGVLYDVLMPKKGIFRIWHKILLGTIVGLVAIALMLNPMKFAPGLIFDTRTVLVSLVGLFFGYVPTIIAFVIAAVFRASQGGSGIYMGVATIASAALLGGLWHCRLKNKLGQITYLDFYLFGVIVHLAMLACCVFLPHDIAFDTFRKITPPVLTIYPLVTVFLGILLAGQYRRQKTQIALQASENSLRALFEQSADLLFVLDRRGNILEFSPSTAKELGYTNDELTNMNIDLIDHQFKHRENEKWFWEKLPREKSVNFEVELHRKNATQFPADVMLTRLDRAEGVFVLASCRNTEERKRQENEIAIVRNFADNLIKTANTMIVRLDVKGNLITFNQMAQEITGYAPEELCGQNWFEALVPRDRYPQVWEEFNRLMEGGLPREFENPILTKDGQERYIVWRNNVIIERDEVVGTISFGMDITERRNTEEALRESEEKFKFLFDTMAQGVTVQDRQSRIIEANHAAASILGLSQDQLLGKTAYDPHWKLVHEDGSTLTPEKMPSNIALATGQPVIGVICGVYIPAEERYNWIIINSVPRFLPGEDQPYMTMTTFTDITARKQMEKALRDNQNLLNQAQKIARIGSWVIDVDNQKVYGTSELYRIFGLPYRESVSVEQLGQYVDSGDWPRLNELMSEAINKQAGYEIELRIIRADGQKRIILCRANAQSIDGTDRIGLVGTSQDITELKKAEEEKGRLLKQLQIQNEELESIIYVSSHDLRSPLINIQGFSEQLSENIQKLTALLENDLTEQQRSQNLGLIQREIGESINFILSGVEKLDMLQKGLLKVCRLGYEPVKCEELDMNSLVKTVADSLRYQIEEVKAELKVENLPDCHSDRAKLTQVFTNLIANALKYRDPQRKLEIVISGTKNEKVIKYTVHDNGIGIHWEFQKKIFEMFHQLDPDKPGEGLGLTIVKRILDQLNATIIVQSEPGQGSVFYITLPRRNN